MSTLRALLPCIFVVSAGYFLQVDATTDYITISVSVPNGTVQHGYPRLVCPLARWYDIAIFYFVNYVFHAATVKSIPGEKTLSKMFNVIAALLFPYSGVIRGVEAMARHGTTYSDHLKRAVRSGALCIVIRIDSWTPKPNHSIQGIRINREAVARDIRGQQRKDHGGHAQARGPSKNGDASSSDPAYIELGEVLGSSPSNVDCQDEIATYEVSYLQRLQGVPWIDTFWSRKVHGLQWLPEGYGIAVLPSNAVVHSMDKTFNEDVFLHSSQNVPKALIAVVQSIFAGITLYRTRGDQLDQYGYAAFGLTVLPYLIMSIINLLGNIATPDYPSLYLVKSPELEEAESGSNGGVFNAVVGEVTPTDARAGPSGRFEVQTDNDIVFRGTNLFVDPCAEPAIRREAQSSQITEYRVVHDFSCTATITVPPYTEFKTEGSRTWNEKKIEKWSDAVAIILGAIPYGVIGGLTRFHTGNSTRAQQVLTQFWLAVGIFIGSLIPVVRSDHSTLQYSRANFEDEYWHYLSKWRDWTFALLAAVYGTVGRGDRLPPRGFAKLYARAEKWYASWGVTLVLFACLIVYAAPAVDGFVVVGQMLNEYGSCTRF